jgi:phage/conjugal plasmid C-4 type zinc finger TraR family protein
LDKSNIANPNLEGKQIMAGGWSRDGAIQDQIDANVEDAVKLARSRLIGGESLTHCDQCEAAIPQARRKAIAGVRLCINCQAALEKQQGAQSGYNRRGSKDSQLK